MSPQNVSQRHNEQTVYGKIQWIIKTFFSESHIRYFESCALETVKTAVVKLIQLKALTTEKVQVKKNVFEHYVRVNKDMNEKQLTDLYNKIAQFSHSKIKDSTYVQGEIRKLLINDIVARL